MPQGSVLGPILFLVYIIDLRDAITVILKLFADDAKVYRSISEVEHVYQVQNMWMKQLHVTCTGME